MAHLKYVALFSLFLSQCLYFFGYVPRVTYKYHDLKNRSYFNKPTIDKVILIVVDSLRPDMVYGKRDLWVNTFTAINESWAFPTIASIQPPSMSLPKIKCIITGSVVGFIDVMFNTDSGKIRQDNLIDILIKFRKFVINFYGDSTWMKLFPTQFNFTDSTNPFYVRDYFQVDYNVSRNIPQIIQSCCTWDMIIMHYLGLDHIGHAEGPFTQATNNKLIEMDNSTGTLVNALFKRKDSNRTLIILTADHGMSDLGGHGGSSENEITVPLIFFNRKFQKLKAMNPEHITQNDIAPSLALLLGVPIPANNIGVIPLQILSLIDHPLDRTKALISNFNQIAKILVNMPKSFTNRFQNIYSNIHKIHRRCQSSYSSLCLSELSRQHSLLIDLMNDIKEILKSQFIQHDFLYLEIAHHLAMLSCLIAVSGVLHEYGIHVSVSGMIFFLSVSSMALSLLYRENLNSCSFISFKTSFCALMLILTGHTLRGAQKFVKSIIGLELKFVSLEFAIILFTILNLIGSSIPGFIKEENQIWFYVNNTLLFLYLFKELMTRKVIKQEFVSFKTTYWACIIILIIDRILRTLNRTGELWSFIPDIGDWFVRKEHRTYLLVALGFCLPIVGALHWDTKSNLFSFLVQLLVTFNGIHRYADIIGYKTISDLSVWIYYSLIVFQIVLHVILKKMSLIRCNLKISGIIFFTSFIVCRHQNIILFAGIAIKRLFYRKIWLEEIRHYPVVLQFVVFNIIGMVTFFQQGNSNSLTTLDVQPGFVGMNSFIPIIIFPVVAIHTFSGNIYWIIIWLEWLSKDLDIVDDKQEDKFELAPNFETNLNNETSTNNETNENSEPNKNDTAEVIFKIQEPRLEKTNHKRNTVFSNILTSLTLITSFFLLPLYTFSVCYKYQFIAWSVYAPKLLYFCFQGGFLLSVYGLVAILYFW